jgi:hypothetical protein
MGYILLWLENLAVSLLLVALLTACSAHVKGHLLRPVLMLITLLIPLLFYGFVTLADLRLETIVRVHTGWFWPLVMLLATFFIGGVEIWRRGRRGMVETAGPAAVAWPRGKLALVLAAVLLLHVMTFLNLDEAVRQGMAQLRAEATARALSVAPQRVPDHENAALIYQQVFDAMDSRSSVGPIRQWPQVWRDAENALEPEAEAEFDFNAPQLGEFLADRAGELAVLRAAAAKPGCYFERDYGRDTFYMLLPEMQDLRSAARLLAVDARHAAGKGNLKLALTDVNAMFAIARHAGTEPILVSMLVSAAVDEFAVATLQEILRSAAPTTEDLAVIDIDVGASYRKLVRRTLFMDEAFILNLFAGLDNSDLNQWLTALGIRQQRDPFGQGVALYRVFMLADDLAGYRRVMRESEEAISLRSYVDSRDRLSGIESELANQRPGIVAGLLLPSVSGANGTAFRTDARHAVAHTGLAMHRFWAQQGRFPDNLQQLSPEVISLLPRDPYDGFPLRLTKTATGWIVYSVGPDLKDESGRKFDDSKNTGDLTFEYVEPPPSGPPK